MQPIIQQCCYRRLAKPAARGREPPKVQNTKICRISSRTAFNSSARRQYAVFLLCDLRVTSPVIWWRRSSSRLSGGGGRGFRSLNYPTVLLCRKGCMPQITRIRRKDCRQIYIKTLPRTSVNPFSSDFQQKISIMHCCI
jgi:hypothetical protein